MEGKELGSSSQADLNIKQQGNKKKSQGQPCLITVMLECGYKVSYLRLFTSECAPNMTSPT